MRDWFKSGKPWIWLNAGAVTVSILMVLGLLLLIAVRGLAHFWPHTVYQFEVFDGGQQQVIVGEIHDAELVDARQADVSTERSGTIERLLIKTGNRDVTMADFRWVAGPDITARGQPDGVMVIERREWGNFYGWLLSVEEDGTTVASGKQAEAELEQRLDRALEIIDRIHDIENDDIGSINYQLERLRLRERRLEIEGQLDAERQGSIAADRERLAAEYADQEKNLTALYGDLSRDSLTARVAEGRTVTIPLAKVVRIYRPNDMGVPGKVVHYLAKLWEFVADEPREANTEGGIFPAIFGTVLMVIVMSILVTPLGVVAAVYLREYARQGLITRIIRVAVNNLAGVPSIVYGVFGLGFFIYTIGGSIDRLFYPEALPSPTYGTGGLLWASITLALLTLPVVIVSTEEGLSRIPRSIREGSLALGATRAETLWRTVLPMASPAVMTGVILAVARAAGEVAPLMLVGVVKLAPSLPLDLNYPFLHPDRKFMHLGFHIYDVGFQSPNVEAARPLVYATSLLLVIVIVLLNVVAIRIRNRLREKYRALET